MFVLDYLSSVFLLFNFVPLWCLRQLIYTSVRKIMVGVQRMPLNNLWEVTTYTSRLCLAWERSGFGGLMATFFWEKTWNDPVKIYDVYWCSFLILTITSYPGWIACTFECRSEIIWQPTPSLTHSPPTNQPTYLPTCCLTLPMTFCEIKWVPMIKQVTT